MVQTFVKPDVLRIFGSSLQKLAVQQADEYPMPGSIPAATHRQFTPASRQHPGAQLNTRRQQQQTTITGQSEQQRPQQTSSEHQQQTQPQRSNAAERREGAP
eukprot:332195-Pleurochrysis_carterae.AAC.1